MRALSRAGTLRTENGREHRYRVLTTGPVAERAYVIDEAAKARRNVFAYLAWGAKLLAATEQLIFIQDQYRRMKTIIATTPTSMMY